MLAIGSSAAAQNFGGTTGGAQTEAPAPPNPEAPGSPGFPATYALFGLVALITLGLVVMPSRRTHDD